MANIKRVVLTAGMGSMLEMYDFVIYGLIAPVFAQVFFPSDSAYLSIMASFAVFATGFFARPLGSIFFGHFGDRLGRKKVLIATMILMAVSSFLIALIPGYQFLGIWAPILLIVMRIVQGFAVGGEFSGAVTFVSEHAPATQRGFMSSWIFFFVNMGVVLASAMTALFSSMLSHEAFYSWGWRVLFILGGLVAIVGIYLRRHVAETPAFMELQAQKAIIKYPLLDVFRTQSHAMLKGLGISMSIAVIVGMLVMFAPSYLTAILHHSLTNALWLNTISVLALSIFIPIVGWLSDKIGRRPLLLFGISGLIFASYPLFILLNSTQFAFVLLGLIGFSLFGSCILGVFGATLAELFNTRSRDSAVAFVYNVPFALFAGTAPMISIYLIHKTNNLLSPSFYIITAAIISCVLIFGIKESMQKVLVLNK